MSDFIPTYVEEHIRSLLDSLVDYEVIYGNQRSPTPDTPYVTVNEITDRLRGQRSHLKVIEKNDTCIAVHTQQKEADVSIQVIGQESVDITRKVELGLKRPETQRQLRQSNISVGTQLDTEFLFDERDTSRQRRAVITLSLPYIAQEEFEIGSIEEIEASGTFDDVEIQVNKSF